MSDLFEGDIPLRRHAEIVQSIFRQQDHETFMYRVLVSRPGERGHRYEGERCVWCGVNYLDELHNMYDDQGECPGPGDKWDMNGWWPLEKMDALLEEHRKNM